MKSENTSLHLIESVLQGIPDPVYVKDREHRFVFVNQAFSQLMGVPVEKLIGNSESDFLAKEFAEWVKSRNEAVFVSGQPVETEDGWTGADHIPRSFRIRKTVWRSPEGREYLCGIMRDVTEQSLAIRKLRESEQRHQIIFEKAPIGVAYIGRNGRIRLVNDAFAKMLGYTPHDLVDHLYRVMVHPEDETVAGQLSNLFQGDETQISFERKARSRSGAWIDTCTWISAVASSSGKVESAVVVMEDIRDRKRAEEFVRTQSEILEQIARKKPFQEIGDQLLSWVVPQTASQVACFALVNTTSGEVKVLPPGPQELSKMLVSMDTSTTGPARVVTDSNFAWKTVFEQAGVEFERGCAWVAPIISSDGKRLGFCVTLHASNPNEDLVIRQVLGHACHLAGVALERMRFDERILEQQAQLFASSKMVSLGEMAAGIAHEINNPLAVIHGRAGQLRELVKSGTMDPKVFDQGLERVEATAMRIAKIIRGLRAFARDGGGDPFVETGIREIIEETLEFCKARFKSHGVDLEVDGRISTELKVECRGVQIGQVILNLLNNAFDAVSEFKDKWVKLAVLEQEASIDIRITDSGTGIPAEIRERIMQPFFTTKEVGKGTGLGLSISKGIIETHQGKVWVDASAVHTTFVVTLPKRQTKKQAA